MLVCVLPLTHADLRFVLVGHGLLFVSLQFTAAGVVQVNVSAQLVPVRVQSSDGLESTNGSRRASLVLPAAGQTTMSDSASLSSPTSAPTSSESEWEIKIEVVDEGIGVSAAEIGNLFQSFRQAKKVQMVFGGTGLGLAISRSVNRALMISTQRGHFPPLGELAGPNNAS